MTASTLMLALQRLILALRLDVLIRPFRSALHKLYCVSEFGEWKRANTNALTLKGYSDRYLLYSRIIEVEDLHELSYLEFGVSKGDSMRWWLGRIADPNSRFFGFDTFDGIPEAWGSRPQGSYTNQGNLPVVDDPRCTFIKGMFQSTLTDFLRTFERRGRLVVHLDADLYSSTLFCLFSLASHFKSGDLLIFDEFDMTTHEFRAFVDFESIFGIRTVLVGEANGYNKVVLKVE